MTENGTVITTTEKKNRLKDWYLDGLYESLDSIAEFFSDDKTTVCYVNEPFQNTGVLVQLTGKVYDHEKFNDGDIIDTSYITTIARLGGSEFCATTENNHTYYFNTCDIINTRTAFRLKLAPNIVENWKFTSGKMSDTVILQGIAELSRHYVSLVVPKDDVLDLTNKHVSLTGTIGGENVTIDNITSITCGVGIPAPYLVVTSPSGEYYIDRSANNYDFKNLTTLMSVLRRRQPAIVATLAAWNDYYLIAAATANTNIDEAANSATVDLDGLAVYVAKKNIVDGKLLYARGDKNKSIDISKFIK